jgi:hypothetical protein
MKTYHGEFLTRPELEALGVTCGGDDVRVHVSTVIINPELESVTMCGSIRLPVSATGKINLGDHIHIASHCSPSAGVALSWRISPAFRRRATFRS